MAKNSAKTTPIQTPQPRQNSLPFALVLGALALGVTPVSMAETKPQKAENTKAENTKVEKAKSDKAKVEKTKKADNVNKRETTQKSTITQKANQSKQADLTKTATAKTDTSKSSSVKSTLTKLTTPSAKPTATTAKTDTHTAKKLEAKPSTAKPIAPTKPIVSIKQASPTKAQAPKSEALKAPTVKPQTVKPPVVKQPTTKTNTVSKPNPSTKPITVTPKKTTTDKKNTLDKKTITNTQALVEADPISQPIDPVELALPLTEMPDSTSEDMIDGVVALVNDTPVLNSQLQQTVKQLANQSSNQDKNDSQLLKQQALDQIIARQLQLDLVTRQGLKAEEQQINTALLAIAKQNGVTNLNALQQQLEKRRQGSYQTLRQKVSEDLAIQALQQQQLAKRINITDSDIDAFLQSDEMQQQEQTQYHTLHIRVPYGDITLDKDKIPTISDSQKQQANTTAQLIAKALHADNVDIEQLLINAQEKDSPQLEGGDMGFHVASELPRELAQAIIALNVGEVTAPLATAEGVNVIKLVDKKGGSQQLIDQWQTRHILISPSSSVTPELAKQQIDNLYEQLRQGADFATLASTYSNDVGSAVNGGSLGWVGKGEMVAEFEKVMQNTEVNDFSIPFQSQFGWHILKVDAKRQQDVADTARRNTARELLYKRQAPQALHDWIKELRSQAYIKIIE
ncbi:MULTISPECIES: peptidylprolyl isomerase [unclassified Moraxella]|uniref:peptidylprolyl isomerase n=1 Tax=unclassified Moraxella TaxID=2685852 RepID=UPI003AF54123